jgi:hypothetical protein
MEKLVPGLVDVMSVFQVPRQQTGQRPIDPAGSLYKPRSEGRIYGCGNGKGR